MNNEHRDGGEFQEIDTVADQKRHDAWLLSRGLTQQTLTAGPDLEHDR